MDRNEKVEFTKEGFQKVLDSLTWLSEDQRYAMLAAVCNQMMS